MKATIALTLLIVGLACALPYPEGPEDDGEYELVELVPLARMPRGVQQRPYYQPMPQQQQQQPYYPKYRPIPPPQNHRRPMPPPEEREPMASSSNKIVEPITAESGHGGHGHDYVDYGAYTGGWGAFGWYSDHPVGGGWSG